jgi:hypothetical protein
MVLPPYYLPGTAVTVGDNSTFGEALLGNLISPARGLFVFSPVLIFAIGGFWLAMRTREGRLGGGDDCDHTYTMYPIGASLLAVPAVALRVWMNRRHG